MSPGTAALGAPLKRCKTCRSAVDERLAWAIGGVCPACLAPLSHAGASPSVLPPGRIAGPPRI
jgi:hypothetical protein